MREIGIGQKQLVEIVRAMDKKTRVLVLDEPTAALTEQEVAVLLDVVSCAACARKVPRISLHLPQTRRSLRHCRPHHGAARRREHHDASWRHRGRPSRS